MTSTPMDPLGQALMDFQTADCAGRLTVMRADGYEDEYPVTAMFAPAPASDIDRVALAACRGHVLDIGAGAGRHTLWLQEHGRSVDAIDLSPLAVEVMRQRGVANARQTDVWALREGSYDTILLLAHGIGIAGTLTNLAHFLRHMATLTAPAGQILADLLDVRVATTSVHQAYHDTLQAQGKYPGEVTLRLHYGDATGAAFEWLHVDFDTLSRIAAPTGWRAEQILNDGAGNSLCRLTLL